MAVNSQYRVGVFGGAFDPPHLMHVALIETAMGQLHLDALHVLPTGQAWHKTHTLSPALDRLAMARLAFGSIVGVQVDPREIQRSGPTYTIDTLRELAAEEPEAQLYLIMGADQARALKSWREWQAILRLAIISVAARADEISFDEFFDPASLPQGRFETLLLPTTDTSATNIRQRVAARQGIAHLVPEAVARYIDHHHLYSTAR